MLRLSPGEAADLGISLDTARRKPRIQVSAKENRTLDGIVFASQGEMRRYWELKLRQQQNEISDLETQPRFDFVVNGISIGRYTADFRYREPPGGKVIVEDFKSKQTLAEQRDFPLRRKLLLALYGIHVQTITAER